MSDQSTEKPWPTWYVIWLLPYLAVAGVLVWASFVTGMLIEPMSKAFKAGRKFMQ